MKLAETTTITRDLTRSKVDRQVELNTFLGQLEHIDASTAVVDLKTRPEFSFDRDGYAALNGYHLTKESLDDLTNSLCPGLSRVSREIDDDSRITELINHFIDQGRMENYKAVIYNGKIDTLNTPTYGRLSNVDAIHTFINTNKHYEAERFSLHGRTVKLHLTDPASTRHFVSGRAPVGEIGKMGLTITTDESGRHALSFAQMAYLVFCSNGCMSAKNLFSVKARHTKNILEKVSNTAITLNSNVLDTIVSSSQLQLDDKTRQLSASYLTGKVNQLVVTRALAENSHTVFDAMNVITEYEDIKGLSAEQQVTRERTGFEYADYMTTLLMAS